MKTALLKMFCLLFLACIASPAYAHFGLVIPSRSMVMNKSQAAINIDLAFLHPFAQKGMEMKKPREFFVSVEGSRTNLEDTLLSGKILGRAAWRCPYSITRPGVYQFAVVPEPYYEAAEDRFIIHYAKTVIGAYGAEDGWGAPLGLPMEIVPLARPFGNYAGNIFTGKVLRAGKPLPDVDVEVEFFNKNGEYKAPNEYLETQVVTTDGNGVFSFGIPWAGWWGFAALATGDDKLDYEGQPREVELGAVIWLEYVQPQLSKK